MKQHLAKLRLLFAAALVTMSAPASAQEWAGLENSMIQTKYVRPSNPSNYATYEILKNGKVLEELTAFLSPLSLPRPLHIATMECGVVNSWYGSNGIELCYELPAHIVRAAHSIEPAEGVARQDIVVGAFVQVVLHEAGHAIFDLLRVPIFGRQEDAADQISALVMLNFGKDFARRMLAGSAQFWPTMDVPLSAAEFSDEHGTPLQRFYNLLCIAYGGQPETFRDFVDRGVLPKERAVNCGREYDQVRFAFANTVAPHVNDGLLKTVQAIQWAKWDAPTLIDCIGIFLKGMVENVRLWIFAGVFILATMLATSPKSLLRHLTVLSLEPLRGRLERRQWWAYTLGGPSATSVLLILLQLLDGFDLPLVLHTGIAILIGSILVAWVYWAVLFTVGRLHDRNKRGWWLLIWLVPIIGPFWMLWILIEAGCLRGTPGVNRFGRARGAAVMRGLVPRIPVSSA